MANYTVPRYLRRLRQLDLRNILQRDRRFQLRIEWRSRTELDGHVRI